MNNKNKQSEYTGPTNQVKVTENLEGNFCATTTLKHDSIKSCSEITKGSHLPGVIIFVHGVNSEGEWYKNAEQYLCEGLNQRLGLEEGNPNQLLPNIYSYGDKERILPEGEETYLTRSRRSPVIRFYWGYRSPDDVKSLDEYLIPLKNKQGESYHEEMLKIKTKDESAITKAKKKIAEKGPYFWGGGPFQNGTTSLPPSWNGTAFDGKLMRMVDVNVVSPGKDRLITASPSRLYYAHASWRLAMLIQRIRDNYPNDTVTLVSHSQGTIISMAASLISAPDSLFVMNSPYRVESESLDSFSYDSEDFISTKARENTLSNVINEVAKSYKRLENNKTFQNRLSVGKPKEGEGWTLNKKHKSESGDEIPERDNHGRTYIYCNAHDRVMGASPLVSIGWQGLPNDKNGQPHKLLKKHEGKLFQRLLARGITCGGKPEEKTAFGNLPDMFITVKETKQVYMPVPDTYTYETLEITTEKKVAKKPFWDDMQYVITIPNWALLIAPGAVMGLKLTGGDKLMPVWVTPPKEQTMFINAEQVAVPVTFESNFDETLASLKESGEPRGWG